MTVRTEIPNVASTSRPGIGRPVTIRRPIAA